MKPSLITFYDELADTTAERIANRKNGVGMRYPWLDTYCLEKKACEKDYKVEWRAFRYRIGGKIFALQGMNKEGRAIINLKIEPFYGAALRQSHKDIIPGYGMNQLHWNSVFLDGAVPDDLLKEMIDESYEIVLNSLPKKIQKEFA